MKKVIDKFSYELDEDEKVVGIITQKRICLSDKFNRKKIDQLMENVEISFSKIKWIDKMNNGQ